MVNRPGGIIATSAKAASRAFSIFKEQPRELNHNIPSFADHTVPGFYLSSDLQNVNTTLPTLLSYPGGTLSVDTFDGEGLFIIPTDADADAALVITADIIADNGVIHIVDTVLLPDLAGAPASEIPPYLT